jgi:peptide/nickel transport system ATP-binding protein
MAFALLGPWVVRFDPDLPDYAHQLTSPNLTNWLGTDQAGRDQLARTIAGTRTSLEAVLVVFILTSTIGLLVGGTASYLGGIIDTVLSRVIDAMLGLPSQIIALAIVGGLGVGSANLILAIVISGWAYPARIARSTVLGSHRRLDVIAARLAGLGKLRIMRTHVLPGMLATVLVATTATVGETVLVLAGLSFLGLGAQPPTAELGQLLAESQGALVSSPWLLLGPAVVIAVIVIAAMLISDALRDALDPQSSTGIPAGRRYQRRLNAGRVRRHGRDRGEPELVAELGQTTVDSHSAAQIDGVSQIDGASQVDDASQVGDGLRVNRASQVNDATQVDNVLRVNRASQVNDATQVDNVLRVNRASQVNDATQVGDVLRVTDLVVTYSGGTCGLRGITLSIAAGECLAIVGESGCGKTTLARAVLGLLPPGTVVDGTLEVGGEDVLTPGRARQRQIRGQLVGYVAQDPYAACDPLRSVGHHVAEAWHNHRKRPPKGEPSRRVGALGVERAEVRIGERPHRWSGGMLQRATIAAAAVHHPVLTIADEPTSALDAQLADDVLAAQRQACQTLLLISHDLRVVENHSDRIAVMRAGQIVEIGYTADVLANPRHPYTHALLAATSRPAHLPVQVR